MHITNLWNKMDRIQSIFKTRSVPLRRFPKIPFVCDIDSVAAHYHVMDNEDSFQIHNIESIQSFYGYPSGVLTLLG